MRDLLFKSLVSSDKRKRILAQHEVLDNAGIHQECDRRLIYLVEELKFYPRAIAPTEYFTYNIYSHQNHQAKIIYRVKGEVILEAKERLFLLKFRHSYQVNLTSVKK